VGLAGHAASDRVAARAHLQQVLRILNADRSTAALAPVWKGAVRVLELSVPDDESSKDDGGTTPPIAGLREELQVATLLCASGLSETATPKEVLAAHIHTARLVSRYPRMFSTMERRLFLPLIEEYWSAFVAQSAFLLRSPSEVRRTLDDARGAAVTVRARLILRVVVDGLGVRCSPEVLRWLSGKDE
jgi:hypothetical protein